ncbi:MAG: DsbA family protein [Candidatus Schmidhempelia sp.]|nr:DsbA family protein [Candidatus Schmidhempelia sp.]
MKKILLFISILLMSFTSIAADSKSDKTDIVEGKQYIKLLQLPSQQKEVIEFFSFYCGACYMAETQFHISDTIKENLPQDIALKKYHIENFGGLSKALSEAWAIANVLDITDSFSKAIFNGIQRDKNITTPEDIKKVFNQLGVSSEEYDSMKSNILVKTFLTQQSAAIEKLKPISVPSFYVNGKYQLNGRELNQTNEALWIKDHSRVINYLLGLDDK